MQSVWYFNNAYHRFFGGFHCNIFCTPFCHESVWLELTIHSYLLKATETIDTVNRIQPIGVLFSLFTFILDEKKEVIIVIWFEPESISVREVKRRSTNLQLCWDKRFLAYKKTIKKKAGRQYIYLLQCTQRSLHKKNPNFQWETINKSTGYDKELNKLPPNTNTVSRVYLHANSFEYISNLFYFLITIWSLKNLRFVRSNCTVTLYMIQFFLFTLLSLHVCIDI